MSYRERRVRLTLRRGELCNVLDALESIIEDFEYEGGLNLAEAYIELEARLKQVLRDLDLEGKRAA